MDRHRARLPRDHSHPAGWRRAPARALFALIGQIGSHAGFLPLALTQFVVAATVASVAIALRQPWLPRGPGLAPVFAFGLLGTAALVFFLLATTRASSPSSR